MTSTHFFCANCGVGLTVGAESAGRTIECPGCRRTVPVPHPTRGCLPILPPEVLALELKFLCPGCGAKLRIDARLEGDTVPCPKCAQATKVPRWSLPGDAISQPRAGRVVQLSTAEIEFLSSPAEMVQPRAANG